MSRMDSEFVTYPIALDLKELGYNKSDFGYFRLSLEEESEPFEKVELMYFHERYDNHNFRMHLHSGVKVGGGICTCPLWQQAIDFLIEELVKFDEYFEIELRYFSDYSGGVYIKEEEILDFDNKEMLVESLIQLLKENLKK